MYNLTTLYLQNDTVGFITQVNTLSNGWLIGWTLIALYLALIIVFNKGSMRKSSLVASMITALVSIYFVTIGWIGINVSLILMVMIFINLFIVMFGGN